MINLRHFPFNSSKSRHYSYEYLLIPLLLTLCGYLIGHNMLFAKYDRQHMAQIQRTLHQKEQMLDQVMNAFAGCVNTSQDPFSLHETYQALYEEEGLSLQIFQFNNLIYWSDHSVSASPSQLGYQPVSFIRLPNGWYVVHQRQYGNIRIAGFILIRNVYTIQNQFLVNEFQKKFDLPATVNISTRQVDDSFPLYDINGNYLFSMILTGMYPYQIYLPALLYLLAIFMVIHILCHMVPYIRKRGQRIAYTAGLVVVTLAAKYICQVYHLPRVVYELKLFNPEIYASSAVFPSLGDLCLTAVLALMLTRMLYLHLSFPPSVYKTKTVRLLIPVGMSLCIGSFHLIGTLIRNLVLNSSIFPLDSTSIIISPMSITTYVITLLAFYVFLVITDKIARFCAHQISFRQYILYFAAILPVLEIIRLLWGTPPTFLELLILSVIVVYNGYLRIEKQTTYRYSDLLVLIMMLALHSTIYVIRYANIKHWEEMEVQATILSLRNDPVAEFFIADVDAKIQADGQMSNLVWQSYITGSDEDLQDYLKDYFFTGYWQKYRLQTPICQNNDDVYVWPDNVRSNCVEWFFGMSMKDGIQIQHRNIWSINDPTNMGASYLMWIPYHYNNMILNLFIKLDAISNDEQIGYPQLLLDGRAYTAPKPTGYSHAVYHDGELVRHQGSYTYQLNSRMFDAAAGTSQTVKMEDQQNLHFIYRPDAHTMIVVTKFAYTFTHSIILFSCILLTFFGVTTVISLIAFNTNNAPSQFVWTFSNKIQVAMACILLFFFATITFTTISYLFRQTRAKESENINTMLTTVYRELSSNLSDEGTDLFSRPVRNQMALNNRLVDLSNIFHTDINIYDLNGNLSGTSRKELYENGLSSEHINPTVYRALVYQQQTSVIHEEHIGKLRYLSGYMLILDNLQHPQAILHLPYFSQRDRLVNEVAEVAATTLNIWVVIFLISIFVSFVIARTITQPLRMIQQKISQISLHSTDNKIKYSGDDEIGALVKEYNQVVDELAVNIQKLAHSERQSVWREMAKQVSHEINNPLTPMKLSIQHLQRAWENKSEKFDSYMDKIPKMLVEQIDLLSSIASEFSEYAKMPSAYNQPMDIIATITNAITLHVNGDVSIFFDPHGHDTVCIYADKEQMLRVFSNLFKNSIQSVPPTRKPVINVDLVVRSEWVLIRVKDNGSGIPEEIQSHIFKPEFTTKSRGMGLGLAIVKSAIDAAGGRIGFRTRKDVGTSFIMRLPLYHPPEEA